MLAEAVIINGVGILLLALSQIFLVLSELNLRRRIRDQELFLEQLRRQLDAFAEVLDYEQPSEVGKHGEGNL